MAGETERLTEALSTQALSPVVQRLSRSAQLSQQQHRAFEVWTESIVQGLISPSTGGLAGFRSGLDLVRLEFRAVHAGVAAGWLAHGSIDEELVCRRSFLGHLIDLVAPMVGPEPATSRLVKAAA
jgi:hypothetical protein